MANSPKSKKVIGLVKDFLKQTYKAGSVDGDTTEKIMNNLSQIVSLLVEAKIKPDADRSHSIDHILINRVTHEMMHYRPLPYSHLMVSTPEIMKERLNMAMMNLNISNESLKQIDHQMRAALEINEKQNKEIESLKAQVKKLTKVVE